MIEIKNNFIYRSKILHMIYFKFEKKITETQVKDYEKKTKT